MPFGDPARAVLIQSGYTRDAYLREILDVMKAKRVLVRVPMDKTQDIQYHDDRLAPLVAVSPDLFVPGRYGTVIGSVRKVFLKAQVRVMLRIFWLRVDQYAAGIQRDSCLSGWSSAAAIGVKNENS